MPAALTWNRYGKSSIIVMDALVSDTHMALEETRIDAGADLVWEELGEGYGTKEHIEAIFKLLPCPIHRMTFAPIKDMARRRERWAIQQKRLLLSI